VLAPRNDLSNQKRKKMSDIDLMVEDDEDIDNQSDKYLMFNLGKEEYGIDITRITAIEELQKITAIPDMPDFVKGVINLRGKVIPAVDLRLRFGIEEKEYDDRTCIVIVSVNDSTIGLIVDIVSEVHEIRKDDIGPPPSFKNASGKEQYIAGLAKKGEEVKIILDVEKIISNEDKAIFKIDICLSLLVTVGELISLGRYCSAELTASSILSVTCDSTTSGLAPAYTV
jgi:purine-binding chemotaxis protein CheW